MSKLSANYPLEAFTIGKLGTIFYEQFASNALRRATTMLNIKGLPNLVTIDLSDDSQRRLFAELEPQYKQDQYDNHIGYIIKASAYLPPILASFCYICGPPIMKLVLNVSVPQAQTVPPRLLLENILKLHEQLNTATRYANNPGHTIADFISILYEGVGLNEYSKDGTWGLFDQCADIITCHEIAHAYSEQLTKGLDLSEEDCHSFEYIADILAITWLFEKWVVNTPDNNSYREMKGHESYEASINFNSVQGINAIIANFAFLQFWNTLNTGGIVTLATGGRHPHLLIRFFVHISLFVSYLDEHPLTKGEPNFSTLLKGIFDFLKDNNVLMIYDSDKEILKKEKNHVIRVNTLIDRYDIDSLKEHKSFIDKFVNATWSFLK